MPKPKEKYKEKKVKEAKPQKERRKSRTQSALSSQQAAKLMKDKYLQQLDQRQAGTENETEYAADRIESAEFYAADQIIQQARPHSPRRRERENHKQPDPERPEPKQPEPERPEPKQSEPERLDRGQPKPEQPEPKQPIREQATPISEVEFQQSQEKSPGPRERPAISPREHERPIKEREDFSANQSIKSINPKSRPERQPPKRTPHPPTPPQAPNRTNLHREEGAVPSAKQSPKPTHTTKLQTKPRSSERKRRFGVPANRLSEPVSHTTTDQQHFSPKSGVSGPTPKIRGRVYPKGEPKAVRFPIGRPAKATHQIAQQRMKQQAVQQAVKAAKAPIRLFKRTVQATAKAATAVFRSLAALVGAGAFLAALIMIMMVAAIANSPFGLFFAEERTAPDAVSVSEAVGSVNVAYNTKLEELQTGAYDSIDVTGCAPDWTDVLAVFAARYAGAEDGVDVATLDADRVDKLTATFWDMTALTSTVETIDHPVSGSTAAWTERILHITVTAKTAGDMAAAYSFTPYQISALNELLADRAALASLAGSLAITSADAEAVLNALPDDLSPERRAVVKTALTLYGKVNYFWGGKSLVIGWDSRWGQLMQVWAAGSPTTGTYRPYGLDCSGFADWVFYNASGGSYIIGHGGGAHMQHTYCTPISWGEAVPGDLVFYPEDEHVGIVCGRDEGGNLQIIHCSSGANNVVITGKAGFTSIARPVYYSE